MALKEHFEEISFDYVPQDENQMKGVYPPKVTENDKRTLRRLVVGFLLSGAILYKRSVDSTLLRYVDDKEVQEITEEVYRGAFDTHANSHDLTHKILRVRYYWSKMESDCCQHTGRCVKC
ncbi:hypothetical protein CR513_46474, partial [Mucuna pruriens]